MEVVDVCGRTTHCVSTFLVGVGVVVGGGWIAGTTLVVTTLEEIPLSYNLGSGNRPTAMPISTANGPSKSIHLSSFLSNRWDFLLERTGN